MRCRLLSQSAALSSSSLHVLIGGRSAEKKCCTCSARTIVAVQSKIASQPASRWTASKACLLLSYERVHSSMRESPAKACKCGADASKGTSLKSSILGFRSRRTEKASLRASRTLRATLMSTSECSRAASERNSTCCWPSTDKRFTVRENAGNNWPREVSIQFTEPRSNLEVSGRPCSNWYEWMREPSAACQKTYTWSDAPRMCLRRARRQA
mmetsp:Transcript_39468/g.119255  ORF Transcript_39468/g.119255 Transcript_39468/m.119255 type:complete len:212 (+) Transcript_39468:1713-2348(+)